MLKLVHANQIPMSFDALDSEVSSFQGGEVAGLTYVAIGQAVDKHSSDEADGYTRTSLQTRPVATKTLVSGMRPFMLVDDGGSSSIPGASYGSYFGTVVGGTAGRITSGTVLGPSSAVGSGKVTCYLGSGGSIFDVSLDVVDTTATTGLVPTNTTIVGGASLYATSAGKLTPNAGAAVQAVILGHFLEFVTLGSLVTTPQDLVTNTQALSFARITYSPEY